MAASRVVWIGSPKVCVDGPRSLAAAGFRVETRASLAELAATEIPEVAVLVLDERTGPTTVNDVTARLPGAKVIAVAQRSTDVIGALASGASDALLAPGAGGELAARVLVWTRAAAHERQSRAAVSALIDRMRQIEGALSSMERSNLQLREMANQDDLTALGNRRSFSASLAYGLEFASRYGGALSLLVADLDGMKNLNDACGHPSGDEALRRVADVIRSSIRTVDHAARIGGDEFAVVMPATSVQPAAHVAERIRDRIESLLLPGSVRLSASLGVASVENAARTGGLQAEDLVARADSALYAAKRDGKNRVEVATNARAA